jgi:hypothetical protein
MMSASFVLMLLGMIFMRLKQKKWRVNVHKKMNLIGTILGVAALGIAVYMISASYGLHFSVAHSIIGIITLALLVINPMIGYIMLKTNRWNKNTLRALHRWNGRAALILMAITIIAGLRLAGII